MVVITEHIEARTKQFETVPEAEAQGAIMMTWLTNQLADDTRPRLEKRGITDIDPTGWYNFQTFLDVMSEIVKSKQNVSMTLVAVGKGVVENLPLEDFPSIEAFQAFVENLHGASVRNMPETESHVVIQEDSNIYIVNNTPVSNDLMYGFWWEMLRLYSIGGIKYRPIPHQDYPSNEVGTIFLLQPEKR
ncbi:MAG: hypothetical protein AAFR81_20280 [Chloroflexota bacterium]